MIRLQNGSDVTGKSWISVPPPTARYAFNVEFDDGLYDIASFFLKAPCGIKIWIGATSSAILAVAILLEKGTCPKLINQYFLLHGLQDSINSIKVPHLRSRNCNLVKIEGIPPLFFGMDDLRVRAGFMIVENLAVHVLLIT